eukprot:TRINITY_DN80688_c0_g1_i1.p1 TRINITY_DN80688_c0_g1~~TRINITY_DN80688_c0_g1_i1.p1  ORF type:complete len:232 (-),score=51.48 TRINITY_DN80688_c0_g1_i1:71-688(-)
MEGTSSPFRILLTGFGPFMQFRENPSEKLAKGIDGYLSASGVSFESIVLPVTDEGAQHVSHILTNYVGKVSECPWDAVIHVGLNASRKDMVIEVMAANIKSCAGGLAIPGGPVLLPSTLDMGAICLLEEPSNVFNWSRDAGEYYCNETLYRSLYAIRRGNLRKHQGRLLPCVFVHIPLEQFVSTEEGVSRMKVLGEVLAKTTIGR